MQYFLKKHRDTAPIRGSCWTLLADAKVAIFDPATDDELLTKQLLIRLDECRDLMELKSWFPAATKAELKKLPQLSYDKAKDIISNKQESDEYHKELDRWKKCHKDFDKKVEELGDTKELLQIARNCQAISLNISNYVTQLDLASLALDK
jgi:hypothetical protein